MRLLFDQNLSWRLVEALQDLFPGSAHVRNLGMDRASDESLWDYAREEGFVIVSKDSDFEQRSLLRGQPPKCIWLRIGNCSTEEIKRLIRNHASTILEFGKGGGESYLVLF